MGPQPEQAPRHRSSHLLDARRQDKALSTKPRPIHAFCRGGGGAFRPARLAELHALWPSARAFPVILLSTAAISPTHVLAGYTDVKLRPRSAYQAAAVLRGLQPGYAHAGCAGAAHEGTAAGFGGLGEE